MAGSPRLVVHAPPLPAHLPHLDALRGFAALMVVLHHARLEARPSPAAIHRAFAWLGEGHFGVTFFVILSGYCLALPTLATGRLRGGARVFFGRRARRLLPAYYVALLGSIALVATLIGRPTARHWDFALPLSWRAVATHALLIHNFEVASILKINHAFWSIAVEWQLYFAMPILLGLRRVVGPWATAALAVVVGYALATLVAGTDQFGLMPHYHGIFALGMLAAGVAHGGPGLTRVRKWAVGLVGAAALAGLAIFRGRSYEALDLPFAIAGASALVLLARPGRIRSLLEWRPLVGLGGSAYSLYLVHAPLQHLLVDRVFEPLGLPPAWEFAALSLAGTPAIVGFAYLFSRAFERPFLSTTRAVAPADPRARPSRYASRAIPRTNR